MQGTKDAAGRGFSSQMVELALSSYPGLYSSARHNPGQRSVSTGPHCSTKQCSSTRSTTMTARPRPSPAATHRRSTCGAAAGQAPPVQPSWTDELVVASLGEIVHARSGDKGGDANLGVWVRDPQAWSG